MMATPRRRARWLTLLLAFAFALLVAPITSINPGSALADTDLIVGEDARVSYTSGDSIRVRSEPSYSGSVVTSVPEGWLVAVLDGPIDDGDGSQWYQVTARGQNGYMVSDYLARPGSSSSSSSTSGEVTVAAAATTTTALNLRASASLSALILLVMPAGASVETTGSTQNGFSQLTYQGTTGWAYSTYLSTGSSPSPGEVISNAWVIDGALNLRSGHSTSNIVLLVMPNGAQVGVTGSPQSGFTPVRYNGTNGWAFSIYLSATAPGTGSPPGTVIETRYTTAALNLRSGTSTSTSILRVIPSGAAVGITGSQQNGFFPVSYSGTTGFASATYLSTTQPGSGSTPTPAPSPPSDTIIETRYATASLNLRSGAGLGFGVLTVIPQGGEVGITGSQQNGFFPVRYDGTSGFSSATYLSTTPPGSGPDPDPDPGGNTGDGSIVWPVSGGTWEITQGYNGSSHINTSSTYQYLYAMDLAREDRATGGQSVYSPVTGTVRWTERGSGGITIDMGNGYAFVLFHVTVDRGWVAGDTINQGDYIGYISYAGGEGFVQFPHVHITVWATTDGGNWSRQAVPFSGQNSISGNSFPDVGGRQQWTGTFFNP
ncbi:SH3 domain-containing protein [soil metagenome]